MITNWRKSRQSATSGGQCVEVGCEPGAIGIRDSKNPGGGQLTVNSAAWASFVTDIDKAWFDRRRRAPGRP